MPEPPTRRPRLAAVATGAEALAVTAGCAHPTSGPPEGPAASQPAAPTSSLPTTLAPIPGYHTSAAALAVHIPGCQPRPLTPANAARQLRTGATPAATCTLRGHGVALLAFTDPASQTSTAARLRTRVAYYATGPGWIAAPTDTSDEPVGQESVVQDAGLALHGTIHTGTN